MEPGLAESLIEGREGAFFAWWFRLSLGSPDAMSPVDVGHYASAYAGRKALAAGLAQYRTLLRDIEHDRPFAATRLPVPVLAVTGGRSVGGKLAEGLAAAASDLQSVVIPGCGHFVPEERPQELAALLVEFLRLGDAPRSAPPPRFPTQHGAV